jgi:hypothetical protein
MLTAPRALCLALIAAGSLGLAAGGAAQDRPAAAGTAYSIVPGISIE